MTAKYYLKPEKLISFYDLCFRWSMCSYYTIPFFTVLRKKGDQFGFYLHLYKAESISFSKTPGVRQPNANSLTIKLAWFPPFYFRIRYEDLYAEFEMLYFKLDEVTAIEEAHPECFISDPEIIGKGKLNETTKNTIAKVAALTLWRMASEDLLPDEGRNTFIEGFQDPNRSAFWTGMREAQSFQIPYFPDILCDRLEPNIPVTLPKRAKKKRTSKLEDYEPIVQVLQGMGIRDQKKCAKIVYSLYPFLTQEEIGTLFPAKPGTKISSATARDRGRVLLGLRAYPNRPHVQLISDTQHS